MPGAFPTPAREPPSRPANDPLPTSDVDALLPAAMAQRAERIGADKTRLDFLRLLTLAVLAGAFIGFGAMLANVALAGAGDGLPYGVARLLAGAAFSLGLVLVVVGGAELFTGNNLMVMAWAAGRVGGRELLRAWTIVFLGNLIGAGATALLVFLSGVHELGNGAVAASALASAEAKAALPSFQAFLRGVLGNVLVCLAVWLSYSARSTTDRILSVVPPVTAFVAAGFEHSIANAYILPLGLLLETWGERPAAPEGALGAASLVSNLLSVTLGNMIGGVLLVGIVYWFVYLRRTG